MNEQRQYELAAFWRIAYQETVELLAEYFPEAQDWNALIREELDAETKALDLMPAASFREAVMRQRREQFARNRYAS